MLVISDTEKLTQPCDDVELFEGLGFCMLLRDELERCQNGAGLAAPQIGINKKACVISVSDGYLYLINPKIISYSQPSLFLNEGCLSFPGVRIHTVRYNHVIIEDTLHGIQELNNFAAIVAQHEIDHLNGILFFERRVPEKYATCFCKSGKKFKFCCYDLIYGK